jgi:hypothetical protein
LGEYGKTTNPGLAEAEKLAGILASVGTVPKELIKLLNEFYLLWTGVGNFGQVILNADVLYKLLLDENAFPTTEVTVGSTGPLPAYDLAVPGMPDVVNQLVGAALYAMVKSGNLKVRDSNVCNQCWRKPPESLQADFKRDYEGLPNENLCFLTQGYYCLGPLTKAGCSGLCPNNGNAPCAGCFGPTLEHKGLGPKYEEAFAKLMNTTPDALRDVYKDAHGMMYRFLTAYRKEDE